MEKDKVFHIQTLRLRIPEIVPSTYTSLSQKDSLNSYSKILTNNNFLKIDKSFGRVYVGDELNLLISITNKSFLKMDYVKIYAFIQTDKDYKSDLSKNLNDFERRNYFKKVELWNFAPEKPKIFRVKYNVKIQSKYQISLNLVYKPNSQVQQREKFFNRRFSFEAIIPFQITYTIQKREESFSVQYTIQNVSKYQFSINNHNFRPSVCFSVKDNQLKNSLKGKNLFLSPGDIVKLIFHLQEKPQYAKNLKANLQKSLFLGNLVLKWFNFFNGPGLTVSKDLRINITGSDLQVKIVEQPMEAKLFKMIPIKLKITNK